MAATVVVTQLVATAVVVTGQLVAVVVELLVKKRQQLTLEGQLLHLRNLFQRDSWLQVLHSYRMRSKLQLLCAWGNRGLLVC